jgi:hypothetical protein
VRTWEVIRRLRLLGRAREGIGQSSDRVRRHGADSVVDLEILPLQRFASDSSWVGIAHARRYQQDTYTTIVRRTRGPRTEGLRVWSRT